jgi:hypothetical protein
MWIRFLKSRKDNPLFAQACRRLRRSWWRSWVAPALLIIGALYGFLIVAEVGIGLGPGVAAKSGLDTSAILRLFLIVLAPLLALFSFVAGAKAVQRDHEKGTLEALLLTDMNDVDLLAGKVLGTLLPFFLACLLLLPAVIQFGTLDTPAIPPIFSKNWRLSRWLEAFWYLPHWEMLVNLFLGTVLGVVYGIHRAAHYRRPSMIYSFGIVTFILFVTVGIQLVSNLFQALIIIAVNLGVFLKTGTIPDLSAIEPFIRVLGGVLATWLVTLIPLFELAEQFRYLVGEEQDPRYLRIRTRAASTLRPTPWTERKGPATTGDVWAEEWEKRKQRQAAPRSALMPRGRRQPPRDDPPR